MLAGEGCRHRVGRVLSFSQVVGIGTPPTPHPQASVPPFGSGGGASSLAKEGVGESQFRRGDIHCGTLYMYVLCGCRDGFERDLMREAVVSLSLPLLLPSAIRRRTAVGPSQPCGILPHQMNTIGAAALNISPRHSLVWRLTRTGDSWDTTGHAM